MNFNCSRLNLLFPYFRYGYGAVDLSPNYDPFIEEINRKTDDLIQELLSIKQKLISLKFGNDLNVVKNIDERIQRLLVMFDFKPEDGDGSMAIEDSSGYANIKWFLFVFEGGDTY